MRSVAATEVLRLSGLLALLGPVEEHTDEFWAYQALFVHPLRASRWPQAIAVIAPDQAVVGRVFACCRAYGAAFGATHPISRAAITLDTVVKVMVQVPNPDEYVAACLRKGMDGMAPVWSEAALKRMRLELRGSFADTPSRDVRVIDVG